MPDLIIAQPFGWVDVYAHFDVAPGTVLVVQNKDSGSALVVQESVDAPDASDTSGTLLLYGNQYTATSGTVGCWVRQLGQPSGYGVRSEIFANVQWPVGAAGYQRAYTPLDRRVTIAGDSRAAAAFSSSTNPEVLALKNQGFATWVGPFSDGKVETPHARNKANGGDTSTMWLEKMADTISTGADVYINLIDINDRGGANMTADQTKENLLAGLKMQRDTGAEVIICASLPATFLTGQQLANHREVRRWMLAELPKLGYLVPDAFPEMVEPGSATDQPKTGLLMDDRHPAPQGAIIIARAVGDVLKGLFAEKLALPSSADGWLNPNPTLTGTTGSRSASANSTGTVAASTTLAGSSYTGGTCVASKEANPRGGEYQVLELGGTPTAATPYLLLYQAVPVTGLTVGQVLRAVCDFEWSGLVGVYAIALSLTVTRPEGVSYYKAADRYSALYPLPASLESLPYETPPCVITGTETAIQVRAEIYAQQNVAIAGRVKTGRMGVK